jgi:hypothetical protein
MYERERRAATTGASALLAGRGGLFHNLSELFWGLIEVCIVAAPELQRRMRARVRHPPALQFLSNTPRQVGHLVFNARIHKSLLSHH